MRELGHLRQHSTKVKVGILRPASYTGSDCDGYCDQLTLLIPFQESFWFYC